MRFIYFIQLVIASEVCDMTSQQFALHASTMQGKLFDDANVNLLPDKCVKWLHRIATKISREFPKASASTLKQLNALDFNRGYIPWYIITGWLIGCLLVLFGIFWCFVYVSNTRSVGLVIFGIVWIITFGILHLSIAIHYNLASDEPNLLHVFNKLASFENVRTKLIDSLNA